MDAPDLERARDALADVVPRLIALVRDVHNPSAHAVGEWNVADVALHLAHVWEALPPLSRREMAAPLADLSGLPALTTALVSGEADRDLGAVTDRIEAATASFLTASAGAAATDPGAWLVEGVSLPAAVIACHLLSETLVHGHDIAAAEAHPWPIAPAHAALAITGFVLPVLAALDARALVDQERAAGFHGTYEVSFRGRGRAVFAFDNGAVTVEQASPRRADCYISADPAAFLLVMFARQSQWSAHMRGQMFVWGRKPWLAPKLRSVMRNP